MKRWCLSTAAVTTAAAAALGLAGCRAKPKPMVPPMPPPAEMSVPGQRAADAAAFRSTLAQFDARLAGLPGHTEADHRAAAAATLADLTDALRVAYGTNPPPGFTADVMILEAATRTVAMPDVPRARMEAAENEAIQAATAGLSEIAVKVVFDDAALPPLIDAANAKLLVARASQGPQHDGDATDALAAIGVALHQIDGDLQDRFAKPMTVPEPAPMPAPVPATLPAPTPTTEPATMPTTMPATMPTTMP